MSIDGSGKPNLVPFSAMWRYNCAFVDDPQNIKKLLYKGFGAKDFSEGDRVGPLALMDEEALYLQQQGMLAITDSDFLSDSALFSRCHAYNPDFPLHYKVIRIYRFSIRSGINYGVHYALYRTFPHLCHAEFCVFIANNTSYQDVNTPQTISYQSLSALTRVMPVVLKSLLICHVANGREVNHESIRSATLEEITDWTITSVTAMVRRKEMRNKQGTPASLAQIHERIHNSCKSKKKRKSEKSELKDDVEVVNDMQKQKKVDSNIAAASIVFYDSIEAAENNMR